MVKVIKKIIGIFKRLYAEKQYAYWKRKAIAYYNTKRTGTSDSDNGEYPAFCYMAAHEDDVFKSFRRNPVYNGILEHVSKKSGEDYLRVIESEGNYGLNEWDSFAVNDQYGHPRVYKYLVNGSERILSPTTVRYVRVLQDISKHIDMSAVTSVAEIGIGYGGQCRVLSSYYPSILKYTLYDLPEVLELAGRYLKNYSISAKVELVDGTKLGCNAEKMEMYDLVISNYAFSELIRVVQDIYLEKVILKSKHGYMIWNTISFKEHDGYSKEELLKMIPGSREELERPCSSNGNCVIVW